MNTKTGITGESKEDKDEDLLEKAARFIDPPGRKISDDELIDPGANVPDSKPAPGGPVRKSPDKR